MLNVFYSGTEKSRKLYDDILNRLKKLEEKKLIDLTYFPSDKHFRKQNDFPDLIITSIQESDVFVVLFDEVGKKNQWVNQEVGIAMSNRIYILALAFNISGLYGFVNKNKQTIIKPSVDELEKKLNTIREEMKEKIYVREIENQILEIKKIIDYERIKQPPKDQDYTHEIKKLNTIKTNLDNLNASKNTESFYNLAIIEVLENDKDFILNNNYYTNTFKKKYALLIKKLLDYKMERIRKIK